MQKVIKFLEKYAEWLALGLAGAWLLFVVYSYWLTSPVVDQLGNKPVTPATVDMVIAEANGPLDALGQRMAITKDQPPTVPNYWPDVLATIVRTPSAALAMGYQWGSADVDAVEKGTGTKPPPPDNLAEIPEVVAPTIVRLKPGSSVISLPAAAPGAGAAAAAGPLQKDRSWIGLVFKFDEAAELDNFKKANLPDKLRQGVVYLQVELQRQERQPDGNWGAAQVIAAVVVDKAKVEVLPAGGTQEEQRAFALWAEKNVDVILRPNFWTCVGGVVWSPGADDPSTQPTGATPPETVTPPIAKPPTPPVRPPGTVRPPASPVRPPANGGARPRNPGRGGAGGPVNALPSAQAKYMAAPPQPAAVAAGGPPFGPGGPPFGPGGPPFGPGGPMGPGGPVAPPVAAPRPVTPLAGAAPDEYWVHDDTVQAGKTYRYRVRVRIKNPLFDTQNIARNPKDASVFAIPQASDKSWSAWSEEVSIPSLMQFFVKQGPPHFPDGRVGKTIKIDVFRWQGGRWTQKEYTFNPGDKIVDEAGNDTGWMVADVQEDSVLLVDDSGATELRTVRGDQQDPEYKKMQGLAADAAAADASKSGH